MPPVHTPRRVLVARLIAILADFVQIVLLPASETFLFPLNEAMDVVIALAMIALLGWHWAFLPAFLAELIPFFDLVPTWTAAVLIATRQEPARPAPEAPAALPPGSGPRPAMPPPDEAARPRTD
jgi:hypothetical protein